MRCITIDDVETHMTRPFLIPILVLLGTFASMNRIADGFYPFAAPQSGIRDAAAIQERPDLAQLDENARLIVATVRKSNPETPVEQAEAIQIMMDL